MIEEIATLVDRYRSWLKDKTVLRELNGHVEITTPFLDRHNDFIQIYARRDNGGFLLTDDGYTIDDLKMSGCLLDTRKRQDLLKVTLAGFGVKQEEGALIVHATADNFPLRKHNLIQAILAVNDLFYLAQPYVASVFLEDVAAWLEALEVRFMPNVKFTGKSGYDHLFDFGIPKSKTAPERLLRAINNPTKDAAQSLAFSWVDTRDVRPADSRAYAILNDRERAVPSGVEDALKSYEVVPVPWSRRDAVREALAA
jgi:Domain of unknown function DUF1829/Domain of unknown function DUF1828